MSKYSIGIPIESKKGRRFSAVSHIKKYLDTMAKLEEKGKANPKNYTPVIRKEKIYSTQFSKILCRQFYYLTFHMKRYSMHYEEFRLQMRNTLFGMDSDIKELCWLSETNEDDGMEQTDEVSLVIISNEADWLMTNLLKLDRIYHRYKKSRPYMFCCDRTEELESRFCWAYGRIRRLRKASEYFKLKMARDFGYAETNGSCVELLFCEEI